MSQPRSSITIPLSLPYTSLVRLSECSRPGHDLFRTGAHVRCGRFSFPLRIRFAVPVQAGKAIVNVSTSNTENTFFGRARHALNYALNGAGPASYVLPALCFVKSRPELEYPDLQIQFGPMGYDLTETGLRMLDEPAITLQPNVNRTRSRGYLTLRSTIPQEPPIIYPNMMGDKSDLHTLTAGGKISRSILHTKAFAPFFVREHSPGPAVASDDEWNDYVRGAATACHHPCGTCKMGTGDDAVVDPALKVIGVERLRVIDSSIIPQIPSGNLNSISMVIGEKGSDIVRQSR